MTTNQTIDGVPRHLIDLATGASGLTKSMACKELRALLDSPAKESEIDSLRAEIERWKGIAGRRTAERTEFMNERDDLKADQPQGEPAVNPVLGYADSYRAMARQGVETVSIWSVITDLERNIAPLYAELPARAARPEHANPPPGNEPCGTHHDNDGLDDYRNTK